MQWNYINNAVAKGFGEGDLALSDVENDDLIPSKDKRGDWRTSRSWRQIQ